MVEVLTLDPRWGSGSGSERKEVRCRFVSIQLRLGTIYGKTSCVYTARPVVCSKHVGIINPRRACAARVTVVVLCVCLSVCLSVCLLLFSHHGLRGGL